MPNRSYTAGTQFRYGFNGQENSNEIFEGSTTALFWEYDGRTGRRWNMDPDVKDNESPYATFSNNPIFFSDILGNTPGDPKQNKKDPEQVNLSASQISAAISSALFSIHTNTIYKRSYFVSSGTPEDKKPYLGIDLYDDGSEKILNNLYGVKQDQVADFIKTYKNYYNNFATIGMWFDGSKNIEELYKAIEQVSPDKQYKLANAFIRDFVAKNAKWQELSKAGVTFGNILLMYGGQELQVGKGINAPFKSTVSADVTKIGFKKLQALVRADSKALDVFFKSKGSILPSKAALLNYRELATRMLKGTGGAYQKLTESAAKLHTERIEMINNALKSLN